MLSVITKLCIRSLEFIQLLVAALYPPSSLIPQHLVIIILLSVYNVWLFQEFMYTGIIQYWFFCVWLNSFSIISSRSIHGRKSFSWLNDISLCMCISHLIQSSFEKQVVVSISQLLWVMFTHGHVYIFLVSSFSFLWAYTQKWDCWIIR